MSATPISLFDRSEEISKFASGFFHAVEAGTVFKSKDEGGGYALTSAIRHDYHIPTGTAPITLAAHTKMLQHMLQDAGEAPTPGMIRNLEAAVQSLTLAEIFVKEGRTPLQHEEARHVAGNIDQALPDIRQAVGQMKRTLGVL